MSGYDSFVISEGAPSSDNDDMDSLPSISSGVLSDTDSESDAQQEWEESLEQLQLLLTMVIVPFAGKYLGRKFAYWSKHIYTAIHSARQVGANDLIFYSRRLGAIHGMDAQCRNTVDEQEGLCSCRDGTSCCNLMTFHMENDQGDDWQPEEYTVDTKKWHELSLHGLYWSELRKTGDNQIQQWTS